MLADASCVANRSRCVSNSHKVFSQLLCGYFKYVKSFRFSQFEAPVYGCACVRKSGKVYKLPGGDLFGFLQVALSLLSWPCGRRLAQSDGGWGVGYSTGN